MHYHQNPTDKKQEETQSLLETSGIKRNMLGYLSLLTNTKHVAAQLFVVISYTNISFIEPQLSTMMHTIDETFTQGFVYDKTYFANFKIFRTIGSLYWGAFGGYILGSTLCSLLIGRYPHKRHYIMHISAIVLAVSVLLVAFVQAYSHVSRITINKRIKKFQMLLTLLLLSTAQSVVDSIALTLAIDAVLKAPDGEWSRPRVLGCVVVSYNLGYIVGGVGGGFVAQVTLIFLAGIGVAVGVCQI